jgi:putative zinc finger/helix-turn-helix YgiT family protein
MKSPFTGGLVTIAIEKRSLEFRKDTFEIYYQAYLCNDTGEQFTTDELDEVNTRQVYHKYREKYGLPFPEEIKAIREQYGLSAAKISEILGFGINVYRSYEMGEVPSVSNGRMIQMIKDAVEFRKLVELNRHAFTTDEFEKIERKVKLHTMEKDPWDDFDERILLGSSRPSIFNGYRVPDLDRVNQMILFFAERLKPFKTKMNKLLFYSDFLHFKHSAYSISGLTYKAIQMGPVPCHYDMLFDHTAKANITRIVLHDFGDYVGEQVEPGIGVMLDKDLFSASEMKAMDEVVQAFGKDNIKTIIQKSHEENGWQRNIENFSEISYEYGFELKYP